MQKISAYPHIVLCLAILASSLACNGDSKTKRTLVEQVNIVQTDSSDAPHSFSCASIEKLYSIDMQELNGYYAKVYVYVSNKDSIYAINKCIQLQYENKYKQVLSVWYLDKKHFAKQYVRAIDDENISDEKFEQIDKHLIATFEKFVGQEGHWDFNQ